MEQINLLDLGSKARSKAEHYRLLTAEEFLYLPPYKQCPIDFIADIIDEKKMVSNYSAQIELIEGNIKYP